MTTSDADRTVGLQDSQTILAALPAALREGIFATDSATGHIMYWSKGAESLFHYAPSEIIGWTPEILYPGRASFERFSELTDTQLRSHELWRTEWEYQRRGGDRFPAEVTVTGVAEPKFASGARLFVVRDVGDRKRAEAALRTRVYQLGLLARFGHRALAATRTAQVLEQSADVVTQALHVEFCAVYELLADGHTLKLTAGKGWKGDVVSDEAARVRTESPNAYPPLSTKAIVVRDFRKEHQHDPDTLLGRHGVRSGLSVLVPGPARPFGVLAANASRAGAFNQDDVPFLQDVANILAEALERLKVEGALRRSEARLRDLIHTAQDAIVSIDQHGQMTVFNDAAQRMFGYSAEEAIGRNVTLLMPEPYASEHDRFIARYQRTGEARAIGRIRTVVARRKSGEVFPAELSVTETAEDRTSHYTAIVRDVTLLTQRTGDRSEDAWARA